MDTEILDITRALAFGFQSTLSVVAILLMALVVLGVFRNKAGYGLRGALLVVFIVMLTKLAPEAALSASGVLSLLGSREPASTTATVPLDTGPDDGAQCCCQVKAGIETCGEEGGIYKWIDSARCGEDCCGDEYCGAVEQFTDNVLSVPESDIEWTDISCGLFHTCGLLNNGRVVCWGTPKDGLSSAPVGRYRQLDSGMSHTCAISDGGELLCWGWNRWQQAQVPYDPIGRVRTTNPQYVSSGGAHTCVLTHDNMSYCWGCQGTGNYGQCQYQSDNIKAIAAGGMHVCALDYAGNVSCWGDDSLNQLSHPQGPFESIDAGMGHTCAITSAGDMVCWGDTEVVESIPKMSGVIDVSVGDDHTCAIDSNNRLSCWGCNNSDYGQCEIPEGEFTKVSAATTHTCAVTKAGQVVCWGCQNSAKDDVGQCEVPSIQ